MAEDGGRAPMVCGTAPGFRRTVLALLLLVTSVYADPDPAPLELRDARSLLASLTARQPADPELVARELFERGRAVVPALLIAGRELRETEHLEAIVTVLRRLDASALQKYLLEFVGRQEDGRATNAAWFHLSEAGDSSVVPHVLSTMDRNPPGLKRAGERALANLLVRHDHRDTWTTIGRELGSLSRETRCRVVLAIGESDSPLGLRLLTRLLGRWSSVDLAVVSAIAQMPEAGLGEEVAARLRPYLDCPDPAVRREAITALAVFGDVDSANILIENLSDGHAGVRGNSHWALMQLSGLSFPDSREHWKLWHGEEVEWWEAEGADLLEALDSGTELQVLEALQRIAQHRLYRMRLSPILHKLLDDPSPEIREAAKAALLQLDLMSEPKAPNARVALAAQGITAITPEEYRRARVSRKQPKPAEESGGSSIGLILALTVPLVLLGRLFGPRIRYRVAKLWSSERRRPGPMTLRLESRKKRFGTRQGG